MSSSSKLTSLANRKRWCIAIYSFHRKKVEIGNLSISFLINLVPRVHRLFRQRLVAYLQGPRSRGGGGAGVGGHQLPKNLEKIYRFDSAHK